MPYIAYKSKDFRADTLQIINQAEAICQDYAQQGYDLTLRQLYYQFVARGLIANTQQSYNRLGTIVSDARLAGMLDWDFIVDRTRNLEGNTHFTSPSDIIRAAANSYRRDLWSDQDYRVEVWVEKEALAGVIERVATRLDVDYFSCRGYVSQSEMWAAGQRIRDYVEDEGKQVVILHLGDHDPSGIDMTRDIEDRLFLFVGSHIAGLPQYDGTITRSQFDSHVEVRRIALNMDQVRRYNPPPNPAKITDSRARDYIALHGQSSWELDALDPAVLARLIEDAVSNYRDDARFAARQNQMRTERALLDLASTNWSSVVAHLNGNGGQP